MNHRKRGIALIFNQWSFDDPTSADRTGTHIDCSNLTKELQTLGFEVLVMKDPTLKEIQNKLQEVSIMDHSQNDCLVVAVMTHGQDKNKLFARDKSYDVNLIWEYFLGEKCTSLIGKPKLFFVQACRGKKLDKGVLMALDVVDSIEIGKQKKTITIPTMADFLVMYSSYDDHYSFRNPTIGSWFIKALCTELNTHGSTQELLFILRRVTRRVSYEYTSSAHGDFDKKKQCPQIVSTLTKALYFTPKIKEN